MADITRAAEMAGVAGFVGDLADGYDTIIGEEGQRLSGGQRQRLDLARALVRQAPILILDEPTSNLDAESEVRLREAMRRIRAETETTVIVIAHRLATVAMADKILVLDGGRLVAQGSHDELMSADGWYASAFSAQQAVSGRDTDKRETANVWQKPL
jgi:ABC-type multidrug transport system fused ATPase/permease subunit